MNKWYGEIGFEEDSVETEPGIWESEMIRKNYYGDILKRSKRFEDSQIVQDFNISNQISVFSDEYLAHNLHKIRYITFMGGKWKVTSADVEWPRIILSIGGVYKEVEEREAEDIYE